VIRDRLPRFDEPIFVLFNIFLVGVQVSRLHPREYRIRCLTAINNDERIRIISKPEHFSNVQTKPDRKDTSSSWNNFWQGETFRNELKDDGEDGPVP